ncbi:MAG: di-heme-cytochrome C peroxidase [Pseudomonadota bacterium]
MDPKADVGLIPEAWFRALEGYDGGLIMENLEREGLTPNFVDPTGMPIGFGAENGWVGQNCATCHSAEIHYQGTVMLVPGAPNSLGGGFVKDRLTRGLAATATNRERLAAFQNRVLGADAGEADRAKLEAEIRHWLESYWGDTPENMMADFAAQDRAYETEGTRLISPDHPFESVRNVWMGPQNYFVSGSFVDVPQIWDVEKQASIHYNGNTNSLVERNIISSIATFPAPTLEAVMDADPRRLHKIEVVTRQIEAPLYPEDVFGPIDREKAALGAELYAQHCIACHAPTLPEGEVTDLPRYPAEETGTDEAYYDVFEKPALGIAGVDEQPFDQALMAVMADFRQKWFERYEITDEEAAEFESVDSYWNFERVWVGKPMSGIWATAPYLHNGSVPTMYHLLLPASERPAQFTYFSREYDPVNMGFRWDQSLDAAPLLATYDTTVRGWGNQGHEYGTSMTDDERYALIEYLKTIGQ